MIWILFLVISGVLQPVPEPFPTEQACIEAAQERWQQSDLGKVRPMTPDDYDCLWRPKR